ncbi:MAG: N-acetyltransferase [bacterium]
MICEATEEDFDYIYKLGNHCFDNFSNTINLKSYKESSYNYIYLYKENNINMGFIIINKIEDEIEIIDIAVEEKYRNKKIGLKLCDFIIQINEGKFFLEVNVNNTAAIGLYKKMKFNIIGKRDKYYQNGDDAYIMER